MGAEGGDRPSQSFWVRVLSNHQHIVTLETKSMAFCFVIIIILRLLAQTPAAMASELLSGGVSP